jgi:hypothetical protein
MWRQLIGLMLTIIAVTPSAAASERVALSVQKLQQQTAAVRAVIQHQNVCLNALAHGYGYVVPCLDAMHAHVESVAKKNMRVYLDAVASEARVRSDLRLLDVANDFLFFVEESKTLMEEIRLRLTPAQTQELFNADMAN